MKHTNPMGVTDHNRVKTTTVLSAHSSDQANALNAICPYYTMFPLEYPLKTLLKYKKLQPIVLDPFCGRGTTLFAARKMQLTAWGIDSSPIAVAIAKAKLASYDIGEVLNLARKTIQSCVPREIPDTPFFRDAYHQSTLRDLCALREGLLQTELETDSSVMLTATILGCLHGPINKTIENAAYFSNQMPRTYASKPDYAVKYWQKNGFVAPQVNVLNVIERKLNRLADTPKTETNDFKQVLLGDSQQYETFTRVPSDISVVITSPPYYGMRTYVQDQWLRNWFLGGPSMIDYASGTQLHHGGQVAFAESLGSVWRNIADSSTNDLHMHVRFGIIPSAKVDAKKLFVSSLEASQAKWRIVSTRSAKSSEAGKRQADQMKSGAPAAAIEYDFHVVRV